MRISERVPFSAFLRGRTVGTSLEFAANSPTFRELTEYVEALPEPTDFSIQRFVPPAPSGLPIGSGSQVSPPAPSGSLASFALRTDLAPETEEVARARAARFGRGVNPADVSVASMGR